MQLATGIGAEADDITGVRGDLGLVQNHMKHKKYRLSPCHHREKRLTSAPTKVASQ
jgi:hypothetical protein